jgi:beta-N-acetylhexosaminidase
VDPFTVAHNRRGSQRSPGLPDDRRIRLVAYREGRSDPAPVRLRTWLALAVALVVGAAGLIVATHTSSGTRASTRAARPRPLSIRPAQHQVQVSLVQRLSLSQLAGQRIIYAYSGLVPPQLLLAVIRRGEAAGVILFAPNIGTLKQTRTAIAELQSAAAASFIHAPLLIMTDQEGGLVRRLPGAPELSEKQIGESPDAGTLAAQAGQGAGLNLASVGINVNLAPVLDVFRQPGDFIDSYQRSYGMNPSLVAELGGAFIAAQQQTGVAATAKRFPGLGAAGASQNTDEAPVELDVPLSELRAVDEFPYQTAIAADVRLVMISWATYPALDPRSPAGLSADVIEGELRGRLGFRGVTVTDGIGAGALADYGYVAQRGLLAARAGADLILCSAHEVVENSPAEGAAVLHAITEALADRTLDRPSAEAAANRVLALRQNP